MKTYRFISLILIPTLIFTNFIFTTHVLAQEPIAFGEIKASGVVQIESSTGQWVKMQDVYPLLKNTKLRTGEGVVFITMKDGSRIDLSKGTEAVIDVLDGSYTINLAKGTLYFDMLPSATLTVITPRTTVLTGQNPKNNQGIIVSSDKGTEVRNIAGNTKISFCGLQPRALADGESLFVSTKGECKAIAAAEAGGKGTAGGTDKKLSTTLIIGGLATAGIIVALSALGGGGGGVASPSAPPH
jgi:hypothetical protein